MPRLPTWMARSRDPDSASNFTEDGSALEPFSFADCTPSGAYHGHEISIAAIGSLDLRLLYVSIALLLVIAVFVFARVAAAQKAASADYAAGRQIAFARAQHLRHGINASEWFAQSASDYTAARTDRYTDAADIALMAKIGFDNVRLSIDPVPLEARPQAADGLNAEFLARLDRVVDAMLADGLAVTIDVHPESSYKEKVRSTSEGVDRFVMLWRKLAAHYANRDPERVFFEIMNEPEVNDPYRWAGIQARAAAAIREVAPTHTIIATGPNYSNVADLLTQQPLDDGNVIYNFHYYDPHEFTHQGAGWGSPWWVYTHGIAYPPVESAMAATLQLVPDPANRFSLERYWLDHWDARHIQLQIDAAADWAKDHNVPLICNEFGVYRNFSPADSRMRWIHDVRSALEKDGIGWCMWDYRGGFGVVWKKDGEAARIDDNVVEALGLKK
jgi:endoglucanase